MNKQDAEQLALTSRVPLSRRHRDYEPLGSIKLYMNGQRARSL